jgi:hypothetical protein
VHLPLTRAAGRDPDRPTELRAAIRAASHECSGAQSAEASTSGAVQGGPSENQTFGSAPGDGGTTITAAERVP